MNAREFKERLARNVPVIGTWSHIPAVQVVEIIGAAGFDFIVFDMEHGPHSHAAMPALYCAAEAHGLVPVTRVPGLGNSNVLRALDSGAKGIMIPHVDGIEAARRGIASMYYGDGPDARGVATLTRASLFDYRREAEHLAGQNELIASILMIEDRAGLDDLDAICRLDGLDAIFLGTYDLAQSLGLPRGFDDPAFREVFDDAVRRIRRHGVAVGCYAPGAEAAKRLIAEGIGLVTINVDGGMLRRSYDAVIDELAAEA